MDTDVKGIFTKPGKPEGLVVEHVDSTAPVKKIIDDFERSNRQARRFINANRNPRYYHTNLSSKHYLFPGHVLAAFPDDWDGDIGLDYFQPFRYKCMLPRMVSTMSNQLKQDPVAAHLKLKEDWKYELNLKKSACNCWKIPPPLERIKQLNDEVISCPKHIVDMAEQWDADPDPYFDSSCNWYYAGNGNLNLVCINNREYLLCSEFQCCYLFEFDRASLIFNRDTATMFDCGEGNDICETICSSQHIIALRTRYKIFVLKIVTTDEKLEIQQLKVSESKMAYTGISFDEFHKNILYVTDLNNTLKIVNTDRLKARTVELKNSVKTMVNNWNTVIGVERAYYTHISTNAVTLYDKRINGSVRRWSNPNRVSDDAVCSIICAAKFSPGRPYLYLATNHHLVLMDMRYQRNLALKPIQRWNHGMQCFPAYMTICNFEYDRELICLCSQFCEDTCVVPNYLQRESGELEFKGMTIPFRLPSILETLNEARLQSLCMDVYKSVEDRLVGALTGNLVLEQGQKYALLCQNGYGDVTSHVLYPDHMTCEDDAPQALHEWSQSYEVEKKVHVMSFVKDIKDVWKRLEKIPEGGINKRFENEKSDFSEKEVMDAFENEELDRALLDVWLDEGDETIADDTMGLNDDKSVASLSLNITHEPDSPAEEAGSSP